MSHKNLRGLIRSVDDEDDSEANYVQSGKVRTRCFKWLLLALVSVVSTVSIVVSLFTLVHYHQLNEQTQSRTGFCVLCSELYPEGYFDARAEKIVGSLDRHVDDGVEICCAKNISDRSAMLRLQLKRRDSLTYPRIFNSSNIDTNNLNFGGISAHKTLPWPATGAGSTKREFGDSFYQVRLNKATDVRYEHVSGVDVTPAGLKVKVAGLYFVYKSIFFVPDSSHPCKNFKSQTFCSMLLRNSTRRGSQKDMLLRSEHTCCPDCIQNRETSFTGGIFYLDEGDVIEVEISAYGLVYFKKDASYMGLIIVGAPVPKS